LPGRCPRRTQIAMAATESVKQRAPAALSSAVAFIGGFVPWIVYWILVGNAPFLTAVLAGLALAVVINVSSLVRRQPLMVLEAGTAVVFAVFVIMALTLPESNDGCSHSTTPDCSPSSSSQS
jgi:VIT1/CCC1 family predicted Fe2+/Mn2+ transporter